MGLDDRDDREEQGAGQGESSARANLSPERQEAYDSVLSELEAGADEDSDGSVRRASRKKGAAARAAAPARVYGDDRDAPDADDEDMELLPDDGGRVEGEDEDEPRKAKKAKPLRRQVTPPASEEDDEDEPVEDDDEEEEDLADDDADDEDEEDGDVEDDDDEDVEQPVDKAKLARGWKQLAQKEARDKAAAARRNAAFERDKAAFVQEWQPAVRAAQSYQQLEARAARDPLGALTEFATKICKLEGDGWKAASRHFYLRTPEAEKNPASAAEAAQVRREMEGTTALSSLQEQIKSLTAKLEEKDQAEQNERAARSYLKRAIAMADPAETPLLSRMAKKAPAELRNELHLLAAELAEETGRAVHPRKLIRAWETRQRARLARLGVAKVPKAGSKQPAEVKSKNGAGKTQPAHPGANGAGAPVDRNALRAQVLQGMPLTPASKGRAARA